MLFVQYGLYYTIYAFIARIQCFPLFSLICSLIYQMNLDAWLLFSSSHHRPSNISWNDPKRKRIMYLYETFGLQTHFSTTVCHKSCAFTFLSFLKCIHHHTSHWHFLFALYCLTDLYLSFHVVNSDVHSLADQDHLTGEHPTWTVFVHLASKSQWI